MKTSYLASEDVINNRKWFVIDAADQVLGRLASHIASILKGKLNPAYAPHQDLGDNVIIINAEKVKLTGNKADTKTYFSHTRRPGSGRTITFKQMLDTHPERVIEKAVKGMLPKNPLGRQMFLKLHVYAGDQHPHAAQKPEELKLNN